MGRVRVWLAAVTCLCSLFVSSPAHAVDVGLIAGPWRTEALEKKYATKFNWEGVWLPALAYECPQPIIDPALLEKFKNQDANKVPVFYLPPFFQPKNGCSRVISYTEITSGKYDDSLRCLIRQLGVWGRNALLAPFPDANGTADWMPYGIGLCGNTLQSYHDAYRHIWMLFAEENVRNIGAQWCINVEYYGSFPIEYLYPGDDWVDGRCITGYMWGPACDGSITSFCDGFLPTYTKMVSLGASRATFLETGACDGPWKPWWILGIPEGLLHMPSVTGLLWNEDPSTPQWSFTSDYNNASAFLTTKAIIAK